MSGMLKVEKVSRRDAMSPCALSLEGEMIGQLENLSTSTRYVTPLWWKKSAHRCWKAYSGSMGVMDGIAG